MSKEPKQTTSSKERSGQKGVTRREFLKVTAGAVAAAGLANTLSGCGNNSPRLGQKEKDPYGHDFAPKPDKEVLRPKNPEWQTKERANIEKLFRDSFTVHETEHGNMAGYNLGYRIAEKNQDNSVERSYSKNYYSLEQYEYDMAALAIALNYELGHDLGIKENYHGTLPILDAKGYDEGWPASGNIKLKRYTVEMAYALAAGNNLFSRDDYEVINHLYSGSSLFGNSRGNEWKDERSWDILAICRNRIEESLSCGDQLRIGRIEFNTPSGF